MDKKDAKFKLDIDNRTLVRVMAIVTAFWLAIVFLYTVRVALGWLAISLFLAVALNPPVSYLAARIPGGSRALATGVAYVVVLTFLGLFLYATIPPLVNESRNLVNTIPQAVEQLQNSSQGGVVADIVERYSLEDEAEELASSLTQRLGDVGGPIVNGVGRVTGSLIAFVTILVVTFLMLVEGPQWLDLFWSHHPKRRREHNITLSRRMYHVVTGYVNGQLLIASLAGLASLVAMVIIGIPNPVALAGVVALTGLLPLVGATLGAIVVTVVALLQSPAQALLIVAFFIIYQQIENNVIQPYVQSRTLEISPLLVIVAVVIGIQVGGLLGGFLAIPVAACVRILLLDYIEQRQKPAT